MVFSFHKMTLRHFFGTFWHFFGFLGALLVEIPLLLMMIILQTTSSAVIFISTRKIAFEALLGHFFGTFGRNSLIINNGSGG